MTTFFFNSGLGYAFQPFAFEAILDGGSTTEE